MMLGLRRTGWSVAGPPPARRTSLTTVVPSGAPLASLRAMASQHGISGGAAMWSAPAGRLWVPQ